MPYYEFGITSLYRSAISHSDILHVLVRKLWRVEHPKPVGSEIWKFNIVCLSICWVGVLDGVRLSGDLCLTPSIQSTAIIWWWTPSKDGNITTQKVNYWLMPKRQMMPLFLHEWSVRWTRTQPQKGILELVGLLVKLSQQLKVASMRWVLCLYNSHGLRYSIRHPLDVTVSTTLHSGIDRSTLVCHLWNIPIHS